MTEVKVLVSRAFGAHEVIFADYNVNKIRESIERVNEEWGGDFKVIGGESWKSVVKNWQKDGGIVAHLTMYGLPIDENISKVQDEDVLVIVGAEKVPGEVYELADYNIAVGNQPHSEIAALAIFLDRIFEGKKLDMDFPDAKREIVPSSSGKKVLEDSD